MIDIVPTDRGSKETTWRALAADFNLDTRVCELFLNSRMDNLEDFRFYFTKENDIDTFVSEDKTLEGQDRQLQISRVRRAWSAVRRTALKKEEKLSTSSAAEIDDLLCETDLRNAKVEFWKRYKMRYPTQIYPCDQIISRCDREVERRMLTVYDIWKVRSLKHQVTVSRKRKKVGDGLFTFEEEEYETTARNAKVYLSKLRTYLLALAITGSIKKTAAHTDETFGTDSVNYVTTPWDVLEGYYFRAVESAAAMPEATRLAWLERADLAERAVWVSTFREGEGTIGEVVKQTMDRRGAHWDPPALTPATTQPRQNFQEPRQAGERPAETRREKGKGKGKKGKGKGAGKGGAHAPNREQKPHSGGVATKLPDGKALCPDFQNARCQSRGASCNKGLHKCGKILRQGKICGMINHGGHACRNR